MDRATKEEWLEFLERFFLFGGVAFISFGLMFFIAYNWSELGRFFKFGLVESAIAICIFGYIFVKESTLVSKLLLLAASFLVGVLLALFGQTYQLQADSWSLFFYWGVLILPWAFLSRYATVFVFSIILLNIAIYLYSNSFQQNFFYISFFDKSSLIFLLFALNALSYIFLEFVQKRYKSFEGKLQKRVLLLLVAISVIYASIHFDIGVGLIFGIAVFGFGWSYFISKRDIYNIAVLFFALWIYCVIWIGKIVIQSGEFFLIFITLSAVSILLASYLINKLKEIYLESIDAK